MLARLLPSILAGDDDAEALDVTKVYSVAGLLGARPRVIATRPFRVPRHTASRVSLVGGGSVPRPGELSGRLAGSEFCAPKQHFANRTARRSLE